jgi:hypothetical protein
MLRRWNSVLCIQALSSQILNSLQESKLTKILRISSPSPHHRVLVSSQVGEATALSPFQQMATPTEEEDIEMRMRIDLLISLMRSGMIDWVYLGRSVIACGVFGNLGV